MWANYTLNYSDFVFYTGDIAILPDTETSGSKNTAADGPVAGDNQKSLTVKFVCIVLHYWIAGGADSCVSRTCNCGSDSSISPLTNKLTMLLNSIAIV